jgi:hypothetical protein
MFIGLSGLFRFQKLVDFVGSLIPLENRKYVYLHQAEERPGRFAAVSGEM